MKLIPASSARWMMRIDSSWSVLPQAPNIIAPRHSGLTLTPVLPRWRVSTRRILGSYSWFFSSGSPRSSASSRSFGGPGTGVPHQEHLVRGAALYSVAPQVEQTNRGMGFRGEPLCTAPGEGADAQDRLTICRTAEGLQDAALTRGPSTCGS